LAGRLRYPYPSPTPGLPEQRADGPTTTFSPTRSSTLLQVMSTSCECYLRWIVSPGFHAVIQCPRRRRICLQPPTRMSRSRSPQLFQSPVVSKFIVTLPTCFQWRGLRISLVTFRLKGAIGGLILLCLTGFAFIFFRKRRGLTIPKIRRASRPMSLFDSQEERPGPGMDETAVERPLLYVCGTGSLSLPRFLTRMSM